MLRSNLTKMLQAILLSSAHPWLALSDNWYWSIGPFRTETVARITDVRFIGCSLSSYSTKYQFFFDFIYYFCCFIQIFNFILKIRYEIVIIVSSSSQEKKQALSFGSYCLFYIFCSSVVTTKCNVAFLSHYVCK